jgi:hypothetical protein
MRRRYVVILVMLMAPIAAVAYVVKHNHTIQVEFFRTSPGELRSDVVRRMGKPTAVSRRCENDDSWLGASVANGNCVEELRYAAIGLPEYYTIGFDKAGRAVTKYDYVSP